MTIVFRFSGDILIQKMHSSGILRFEDSVNDMDFWSKVKYTNKGPNSLGRKNSNNIGIKQFSSVTSLIAGNSC